MQYFDQNGAPQTYILEVPKAHIPLRGVTIDVDVSFIADPTKGLRAMQDEFWDGPEGQNVSTKGR